MEELLNRAELNDFLTTYLQVPDWEIKFQDDKLSLLNTLVRRYGTHPKFSFQNVTMASLPTNQRHTPTKQDAKTKCFQGLGGMCIEHNYFFASILISIGYEAYVAGASVSLLPDIPLCHPVCLVIMDGGGQGQQRYLVDYGMGAPFPYDAIPLHQLPIRYNVGGYICEYRMSMDGLLCQRVHIKGDPVKGQFKNEVEEIRNWTDLKPMTFEDFEPQMKKIFTEDSSFFLNNLYAFRYIQANDSNGDFKAIIIIGTKAMHITRDKLEAKEYKKYEDIYPIFQELFPNLKVEELVKAVATFRANNPQQRNN